MAEVDRTVQASRFPSWIRSRPFGSRAAADMLGILGAHRLHSVCQSAACPNRSDCWEQRSAAFLILGETCTRTCGFCAIPCRRPAPPDLEEPHRIAQAIGQLELRHCVLTSVCRDDLPDGGAAAWAETLRQVRAAAPSTTIEILTGDFKGRRQDLDTVLQAHPDLFGHNLETVERLSRSVRPQADHARSLRILEQAGRAGFMTKSSLMLGLGEREEEVHTELLRLRDVGVRSLVLGQYLAPSSHHFPVRRWIPPEEFTRLGTLARSLGFDPVASFPFARSSFRAEENAQRIFALDASRNFHVQ